MSGHRYLQIPSLSAVILIFTPVLLSPIAFCIEGKESDCAFVILWVAVYWISGCLSMGATSLVGVIGFTSMGILTLEEVTDSFFTRRIWLILGSISLAIAAQTTQLHLRIAFKVLLLIGTSPKRLLFGFMLTSYLLSMWMSNTVVTAMMIPIVEGILKEKQRREKQNGKGFSTSSLEVHDGGIPAKNSSEDEKAQIPESSSLMQHNENASQNLSKGLSLGVPYAASIGGVSTIIGSGTNIIVVSILKKSFPNSEEIGFATWFFYCSPAAFFTFIVAYFWILWLYFGISHPKQWLKKSIENDNEATRKLLQQEHARLGTIRWEEVWLLVIFFITLVLWFTRRPGFMPGWSELVNGKFVDDGIVCLATVLILFLIPQKRPTLFTDKSYISQARKRSKTILSWSDIQKFFIWELIFILGGGLMLAAGAKKSGLSIWLTKQISFLANYQPWVACLCLSCFGMLITECTSNGAVSNIMLPILVQVAVAMHVHPYYICLPPVLSTSLAFMLPVATPPNAIAYSMGHIKIVDMLKTGWFLNLAGLFFISLSINTYGVAFFDLNNYPDWAIIPNTTQIVTGFNNSTGPSV